MMPAARAKARTIDPSAGNSPMVQFAENSLAEFATAVPDLADQNFYVARVPLARTWGIFLPSADTIFQREVGASGIRQGHQCPRSDTRAEPRRLMGRGSADTARAAAAAGSVRVAGSL